MDFLEVYPLKFGNEEVIFRTMFPIDSIKFRRFYTMIGKEYFYLKADELDECIINGKTLDCTYSFILKKCEKRYIPDYAKEIKLNYKEKFEIISKDSLNKALESLGENAEFYKFFVIVNDFIPHDSIVCEKPISDIIEMFKIFN